MAAASPLLKQAYDCYADQNWRLNNLYTIVDKAGNLIPFRPNGMQRNLLENMWFLNICLKSRQLGATTLIALLALDEALWHLNYHAGIIAHTRDDVKVLFRNKIKTPFENLPDGLRNKFETRQDSVNELVFSHGSSIRVGLSMRSDTLQFLHISEFGKICNKFPDKAREIRTGALNTVHPGQLVFIESTAEGHEGEFYEMTQAARKFAQEGRKLTRMDYRFHFFPWWIDPDCEIGEKEIENTIVTPELHHYFAELETITGQTFTSGQIAWYVKKSTEQRGDMRREYPSTPDEAFEQSIQGAYFSRQMTWLRQARRLTVVPHDPALPVYTAWDLGRNDTTAIWFFQERPGPSYSVFDYLEGSGEAIQYYGGLLKKRRENNPGMFYGFVYLPHDAAIVDLTRADGKSRVRIIEDMGFSVRMVPRVNSLSETGEGIQAVRDLLPLCFFDREKCEDGIRALDHYQKSWNERNGCWDDKPLHNWASHGAKAFEQFARGHRAARVAAHRLHVRTTRNKTGREQNWKLI